MALASVQRGEERLTRWEEIERPLTDLLLEFGPPRQSLHPEYPFWRLQNDGTFWEIPERDAALELRGDRPRSGDVPPKVLRSVKARGGFTSDAYEALRDDPALVTEITATILEEHFPHSLHESLLDAVGMPWTAIGKQPTTRSSEFRVSIIRLYEHRCAMCGFDGRLGTSDLALEAAHIMWHALGGPDEPANGLLLCSLHHQALDRGAVSLSDDRSILVSQELHGGSQVTELIIRLSGRPVRSPIDPAASPGKRYMAWHRKEVFRRPSRPAA